MNNYRSNAVTAGVCFLVAMAASLAGGGIIESLLSQPDYLQAVRTNTFLMNAGIVLEFMNAIAVLVIAAALFPVLNKGNEGVAAGYLAFRVVETVACVAAAFIPLLLQAMGPLPAAAAAGPVLLAARAQIMAVAVPLFFCLGAYLLYFQILKAKFLPPFIAVWGLAGVTMVLASNFLELPLPVKALLVLPVITNEIFLGIRLIAGGFTAVRY